MSRSRPEEVQGTHKPTLQISLVPCMKSNEEVCLCQKAYAEARYVKFPLQIKSILSIQGQHWQAGFNLNDSDHAGDGTGPVCLIEWMSCKVILLIADT